MTVAAPAATTAAAATAARGRRWRTPLPSWRPSPPARPTAFCATAPRRLAPPAPPRRMAPVRSWPVKPISRRLSLPSHVLLQQPAACIVLRTDEDTGCRGQAESGDSFCVPTPAGTYFWSVPVKLVCTCALNHGLYQCTLSSPTFKLISSSLQISIFHFCQTRKQPARMSRQAMAKPRRRSALQHPQRPATAYACRSCSR